MLNKLFRLFGYEIVKLQSLKDIYFEADGKNPYDQSVEVTEDKTTLDESEVPEEVIKPIVKKRQTSITIHFKDDRCLCWENISDVDDKRFQYADLYTWYFSRTTPLFMFKHNNGETIFRREDILRIERTKTTIVDED